MTAVVNFDLLSERVELSEVGDIQGEDVHVGVPVGEVHQLLGLEMVEEFIAYGSGWVVEYGMTE